MAKVTITLKKSLIGCKKNHIATAHSLGLRKIGDVTVQENNEATQGKIKLIDYLVAVKEG
ncbi:MAG: 50S ribosomal protein L30 [Clostridia bacterium]|nr:50S ribosomal protein L30 [Clostridia bacterium]MBR5721527.1 50S ribosomal protein L30 [Clostridia bacterium]